MMMDGSGRIGHQAISTTLGSRLDEARRAHPQRASFDLRRVEVTAQERGSRQQAMDEVRTLVRAVLSGVKDPCQLTDLVFYMRHPQLVGVSLTGEQQELRDEWKALNENLVRPALEEVKALPGMESDGVEMDEPRGGANTEVSVAGGQVESIAVRGADVHKYDGVIARAVEFCPGLAPAMLKSLLAQESNFNPSVINSYGYAGIAQFGREAAREVGLRVGGAGSATDERLNPSKAIPAAARLLNLKALSLSETAFSRYGQPQGVEFWKFVLAAYNGGEGTVTVAMGHAYRGALLTAQARGLVGVEAVNFARRYATQWENLKLGGMNSPLARAASCYFPTIAAQKYQEIGNYPTAIIARV